MIDHRPSVKWPVTASPLARLPLIGATRGIHLAQAVALIGPMRPRGTLVGHRPPPARSAPGVYASQPGSRLPRPEGLGFNPGRHRPRFTHALLPLRQAASVP
jgi:hypothetical protein